MTRERKISIALLILLITSAIVRAFLAWFNELGYDEVYYWTYAKYPALSHFDHPPMVGWVIRLFSLDLLVQQEFFLRLGAVVIGTVNTWLIYRIGKFIKNDLTGLYAALMYTASLYASVICGLFILPDAPQSLVWLMTLLFLLKALPDRELLRESRWFMLFAGVTTGLALLSKYHAAFLITGTFAFILISNRRWFTAKETWFAFITAIILFLPVLIWNYQNDFASFTFHEDRIVPYKDFRLTPEFFLLELLGEFGYNNPVNFILVIAAFVAIGKGKDFIRRDYRNLILWIHLPMLIIFLAISMFRSTLPHWTGPAYLGFLLLAAARLEGRLQEKNRARIIPWSMRAALFLTVLTMVVATGQVNYGWFNITRLGIPDISLDMYGWRQTGDKIPPVLDRQEKAGLMKQNSPLFTFRWFPAANFDYYLCERTGRTVYAVGYLPRIHKYYWINQLKGDLPKGTDAWFVGFSDDYHDAAGLYVWMFDSISKPDTVNIMRGGKIARQAYVFRLKGLKEDLKFPIVEP
jgi:4-amino-4-deoxy-L-arabinose transferase-like glycosyltransferase